MRRLAVALLATAAAVHPILQEPIVQEPAATAAGKPEQSVLQDEYESSQAQALATTTSYLKDTWSSALKSAVKTSLKEVGKGWFNLAETSRDVYQHSKLKRLLRVVTAMQQDALRYMVEDSVKVSVLPFKRNDVARINKALSNILGNWSHQVAKDR